MKKILPLILSFFIKAKYFIFRNNFLGKELNAKDVLSPFLIIGGLMVGLYFLIFYNVSVEVPVTHILGESYGGGRVNNIGLMQNRQIGIYLGFGSLALGIILLFLSKNK